MIYLDNGATSFPKPPEVIAAVAAALGSPASPGRSGHAAALKASRLVHGARKAMAKLFGLGDNSRVAFTANITWALNLALSGLPLKEGDRVITTAFEHNSIARPLQRLTREKGVVWDVAPVGADGLTDPAEFRKLLRPETKLVAVCHGSNVTGALLDAKAVKEMVGEVPLLLDTAQTAGAVPLDDVSQWADMVAFTGHKGLLGPTGTGGLWVREGLCLRPLAVGGTGSRSESLEAPDFLPDAFEAGTVNTHGLAGLAAGAGFVLKTTVPAIRAHEMALTERFLGGIEGIPGLKVLGPRGCGQRVSTFSVVLGGWTSSDLSAALESGYGILTRPGLHCSPMSHIALGTFPGGATRFSIGWFNTEADIDAAVTALASLAALKR